MNRGVVMEKQALINDYIKRWGNAQRCDSCKFVMAYSSNSKVQICCGKPMTLLVVSK